MKPAWRIDAIECYRGDVLKTLRRLPECSIQCVVTSPPYWGLRDYGVNGQLGSERTPDEFLEKMVAVFAEVRRVLRPDGVLWLNIGDCYANDTKWGGSTGNRHNRRLHGKTGIGRGKRLTGLKAKDLCMIPARLAIALQADGWYVRSDCIWHKPNPMPESIQDRPTKSHEYVFMLTKSARYFYDPHAVKEKVTGNAHARGDGVNPKAASIDAGNHRNRPKQNGSFSAAVAELVTSRNMRTVWTMSTEPYDGAHFATFPKELAARCIQAATSAKGCCPQCFTPWRRTIEKVRRPTRPGESSKVFKMPDGWDTGDGGHGTFHRNGREAGKTGYVHKELRDSIEIGNRDAQRHVTETIATGWQPGCDCEASGVEPCSVLDPFFGSGTVGEVCRIFGRHCIGIELNPEYVELARTRVRNAFGRGEVKRPAESLDGQRLLFSGSNGGC